MKTSRFNFEQGVWYHLLLYINKDSFVLCFFTNSTDFFKITINDLNLWSFNHKKNTNLILNKTERVIILFYLSL